MGRLIIENVSGATSRARKITNKNNYRKCGSIKPGHPRFFKFKNNAMLRGFLG